MPIDVISEPNSSLANSFISLSDYAAYHLTRLPLDPPVIVTGDIAARNVIMATRVLSAMIQPRTGLRWDKNGKPYYYTSRKWTGTIATAIQALAWGREGMFDSLGRAILSTVIPQELKDATAEFAGQLGNTDRTLDSDIAVQGVTSIRAGSVALTFKEMVQAQVLPDMVLNLMPVSWLTDEIVSYGVRNVLFEVV